MTDATKGYVRWHFVGDDHDNEPVMARTVLDDEQRSHWIDTGLITDAGRPIYRKRAGVKLGFIVALALAFGLASAPAALAQKTVTIDNCAKVEVEPKTTISVMGTRSSVTVKCTGEATDPKVVNPEPVGVNRLFAPQLLTLPQ